MKQPLKPKYTQLRALGVLLLVVVAIMVVLYQSTHPVVNSPFARPYSKADGDTLDIAIQLNPSIYSVKGDSASGRDYEILRRISEREGVPMKFHPFVPLAHAMEYLDSGLYDVVVAAIPVTARLKEYFLTTEPVYLDREILVQRADSSGRGPIQSQIQLGGDTVWITANSPIASRIRNLSREIGDSIIIEAVPDCSAEHLFMLVATGVVKQAVINERIAQELAPDYPNIDISTPVSFTQFQSWAVNKRNQALRDSLNAWILRSGATDD